MQGNLFERSSRIRKMAASFKILQMDIFTMVGATNHVVYVHTYTQLFATLATKILAFVVEFTKF